MAAAACAADSVHCPQFGDGAFDLVVDKGALDALMGEPGAAGEAQGAALLAECARVTHPARGVVAVVSLLQDHVLEALLRTFRAGWRVTVRQVPPAPDMLTSPLQPFLLLARACGDAAPAAVLPSGAEDEADAIAYPAARPAAPVELHAASGAAAARVVNAEQLRDVALLVARENAARAAGTALGVRFAARRRAHMCCGRPFLGRCTSSSRARQANTIKHRSR